jgi:putative aminopeptidase FrvX
MYVTSLDYTKKILENLINTPSPSGYCDHILQLLQTSVEDLGYTFEKTHKGNGLIQIESAIHESHQNLLITAHVDTLGAMVRSIKDNGMIRFTSIGGFTMNSIEGEYCVIHKRDGGKVTGTILNTMPSVHVYSEARTQERKEDSMEIRLDKAVNTKKDVLAVGISVGDFISFDPRLVFTDDGYIKSRHLDDKAGIAAILGALHYIKENNLKMNKNISVMFSTYEEVGHGSSFIPKNIDTILAIDMGAIGDDLTCTEKDVSICVKDSTGPYDYQMVGQLSTIAKELQLDYALDVYPSYGSDASAALRGGHNIKAALIGPGVHASHTMERTHEKGLLNTINLILGYMLK